MISRIVVATEELIAELKPNPQDGSRDWFQLVIYLMKIIWYAALLIGPAVLISAQTGDPKGYDITQLTSNFNIALMLVLPIWIMLPYFDNYNGFIPILFWGLTVIFGAIIFHALCVKAMMLHLRDSTGESAINEVLSILEKALGGFGEIVGYLIPPNPWELIAVFGIVYIAAQKTKPFKGLGG